MVSRKHKLTVTIDADVLNKAKKVAQQKNIPLSRIIENFLDFFSNPYVYCFRCGKRFDIESANICIRCSCMKCPQCGTCGCNLSEETAKAIFEMRRVYEDLLGGKVK